VSVAISYHVGDHSLHLPFDAPEYCGSASFTVDLVAACFFESSCSSIFVVVVLNYDQQLRQSSSTSPLLKIFVLQIFRVRHDVTSVQGASCCHHLATKNNVPESLELFALQWLHKKITDHVVGPAVLNLRIPFLYT
jgi:hypothetical protein